LLLLLGERAAGQHSNCKGDRQFAKSSHHSLQEKD
jgi:hypothetical protein